MCIILTYIANYAEERIVTDNADEILWDIADTHLFDGERDDWVEKRKRKGEKEQR